MLDNFFGSLVDGRTLHASYVREPHGSKDDPLSLELAVKAYKVIEGVTELSRRIGEALHFGSSRPVGCG